MADYKYSSYNNNIFQDNSDMEIKIRKYIDSKKGKYINENSDFILLEDDETRTDKEELAKELLDKYISYYNMTIDELRDDKQLLCKIVKNLNTSMIFHLEFQVK